MGFRLIRIGNKVSVGEVSRFSFRHTTRSSSIIFYVVALLAVLVVVYRFAIKQLPMGNDAWILGIMLIISLGYGIYGLWRLHRQVLWYRDLRLQRELRARRRRTTEY